MATKNCMLGLSRRPGLVASSGVTSKFNRLHHVRLISFTDMFHFTVEMIQMCIY
jgi:hypothetical protein